MGDTALNVLKEKGMVPKGRTVTSLRGKVLLHPETKGWYLITYSPEYTQVEAAARELIQWDVQLAHRLVTTGSTVPVTGCYAYTKTLEYVLQYIDEEFERNGGNRVDVAIDLETMGLYPYYPEKHIVSLSATVAHGIADVVYMKDLAPFEHAQFISQLKELLNSDKVSLKGANLKFDLVWIAVKWGVYCTNFRMDTLLVGSLLDENRSNSLKAHAKVYTNMGGYEDGMAQYDMGHMEKVPRDDLLLYAGGDTDATWRVSQVLRSEIAQWPRLQNFYVNILHPAVRAFERIEERGVLVDVPALRGLRDELNESIKSLENQALSMLPKRLLLKYGDDASLGKAALLKDFLFTPFGLDLKPQMVTEKTKQPAITKEHLSFFADVPEAAPFIKAYEEWSVARKTLSTYVDGFMEHLRPDGRFHPTYLLFNGSVYGGGDDGGTVTGRTSAKDPAFQTLPKMTGWAKKLRACYPAPPGHVMFQCDYSQGELRVAACVAEEPNMIEAYAQGLDLHARTAAKVNGYEFDEFMAMGACPDESDEKKLFDKLRQHGKIGNFGLLYGMSADGYQAYAWKAYKVKLDDKTAVSHRNAFFDLYAKLPDWHRLYKDIAWNQGWVESPLGRIRHLPLIRSKESFIRSHAQRQAVNSPIQATLSDMCLWAISILNRQYPDLWIAGMTHDSIFGYIPEDEYQVWLKRIVDVMSNLPFEQVGWEPQLKFVADAEAGATLATLKKVKGL